MKSSSSAPLIAGTIRLWEPSFFSTSTAIPRLTGLPSIANGLPSSLGEDPHHHREVFGRLDDRPGDQVGEGDLQPALFQHRVDRLPFRIQRVDRDRPERGSRRHRPALVHRVGEHRRGPTQLLGLTLGRRGSAAPFPPPSAAASTSSLVTFDPGPEPCTEPKIHAGGLSNPPSNRRSSHIRARAIADPFEPWAERPLPWVAWSGGPPLLCSWGWVPCGDRTRGPSAWSLARSLTSFHLSQRSPNRDLVVDRRNQLGDHPVHRRRHLSVDLVGRDLDDRVALVDRVALGHVPLEHDALGHRLAHLGHRDLHGGRLWHLWAQSKEDGLRAAQSRYPGTPMSYFVTGATGFIGRNLVAETAAARGHDLRPGAGRLARPAGGAAHQPGAPTAPGSCRSPATSPSLGSASPRRTC